MNMAHLSPLNLFSFLLVFLSSSAFVVLSVPVNTQELLQNDNPHQLQHIAQGKQGILEIPKQAATIIRNVIDRNLQYYLNLTTPAPDPRKPDALSNSIVGHFLLGNWYGTVAPAPDYNPERHQTVKPIYVSNEPSYIDHSPLVAPSSTAAPIVSKVEEDEEPVKSVTTQRTRPRRTRPSEKPYILETDTSLNGIYNGAQLNTPFPPTAAPPDVTATGIYNPFGVELNTIDNTDEVYWIDPTRPSVIFPIESTTQRRRQEETTTDSGSVQSTTDEDDDEETRRRKRF